LRYEHIRVCCPFFLLDVHVVKYPRRGVCQLTFSFVI
jgi:hypothetical protein